MIYIIPIEPYKERYSDWWYDYIPGYFARKRKITATIIYGRGLHELSKDKPSFEVETGTVLDASGTNYYKASQLGSIAKLFNEKKIKPYDSFLVCDLWFPGIEMLPYMSELYNIPINIWGIWHAGSITNHDFAQPMNSWAKYFEMGWINMCTGVFVGSDYSKSSISNRLASEVFCGGLIESENLIKKIHALGMPIDFGYINHIKKENYKTQKENIIVFPHRPDEEKGITDYANIIDTLSYVWSEFENWRFVFCTSKKEYKSQSAVINARLATLKINYKNVGILENLSRKEYHKLLHKAKIVVSTTKEENFGYCLVEAAAMECNVICPNEFSHPEIFEKDYRILHDSIDLMVEGIMKLAKDPISREEMLKYVEPYGRTINAWVDYIIGKRK